MISKDSELTLNHKPEIGVMPIPIITKVEVNGTFIVNSGIEIESYSLTGELKKFCYSVINTDNLYNKITGKNYQEKLLKQMITEMALMKLRKNIDITFGPAIDFEKYQKEKVLDTSSTSNRNFGHYVEVDKFQSYYISLLLDTNLRQTLDLKIAPIKPSEEKEFRRLKKSAKTYLPQIK